MSKKITFIAALIGTLFTYQINAEELNTLVPKESTKGINHPLKNDQPKNLLNSRFIRKGDSKVNSVWGIPLREEWWSRPHEYAWAMQFAGPDFVVLDAACGISHPFKWYLADNCKETWACDMDARIADREAIIKETYDDLGEKAYFVLTKKYYIFNKINLVKESIFNLPDSMPLFDRIFCVSTLEHLQPQERIQTFKNFAKALAPNGLLVLTVDYPVVTPEELSLAAKQANLVPVNLEETGKPPVDGLTDGNFSIYRCVYKHAK